MIIQITTAEELRKITENLSAHYELANDISLEGEFEPIGSQFEPFLGLLDGNGHCIKGMHITHVSQYAGLFAYNRGTVQNVCLDDVYIRATGYVGAVAGQNDGDIKNCSVKGSISGTSFVGGMTGYNTGLVKECKAECGIEGTIFTGPLFGEAEAERFEENQQNAFYISLEGSDENSGTKETPLRTLQEAKRRVKEQIRKNSDNNITVYLREGIYYLNKTFELDETDCFHDGRKVTYRSFPGEKVTIVGGTPIMNWERCEDGKVRTFVGKEMQCHTLFVNGELRQPARSENLEDLPETFELEHTCAYFSHGWFSEVLPVKSFDREKQDVETKIVRSQYSYQANYLQGAVEFLKKEGDWALGMDGYLYYIPQENDPMNIVIPSAERIFSLCGKKEEPIEQIVIEGIHFQVSDFGSYFTAQGGREKDGYDDPENTQAALYLENARSCVIRNCSFDNCGVNAISLEGASTRNRLENNRIEKIGYAGIHCQGTWIDTKEYSNHNNFIFNNEIYKVGLFAVHGAGIYLLGSGHNHIFRNRIHDTPRYGISMKGARYGCWATDCGRNLNGEIPFEEHWDYLHSRNNLIQGNEIYDAGKNSLDGGGVEAWGPGRDNVIDYNLVYNFYNGIPTRNWKGHGIFMDDACHYFTVTNNIVYESGRQGADASTFMKSINAVVRNNIFDVTNTHQGAANISPYIEPCENGVFYNNIVYADPQGGIDEEGRFVEGGSHDRRVYTCDFTAAAMDTSHVIAQMDKNLYFNTSGHWLVSRDNGKPEMDVAWEVFVTESGYDKNSICADPLFVNAPERDYTLKEGSPAFALGIQRIEREKIGLIK